MILYNVFRCLNWESLGPSLLMRMELFHAFLWLCNIPFVYTYHISFIQSSVDGLLGHWPMCWRHEVVERVTKNPWFWPKSEWPGAGSLTSLAPVFNVQHKTFRFIPHSSCFQRKTLWLLVVWRVYFITCCSSLKEYTKPSYVGQVPNPHWHPNHLMCGWLQNLGVHSVILLWCC